MHKKIVFVLVLFISLPFFFSCASGASNSDTDWISPTLNLMDEMNQMLQLADNLAQNQNKKNEVHLFIERESSLVHGSYAYIITDQLGDDAYFDGLPDLAMRDFETWIDDFSPVFIQDDQDGISMAFFSLPGDVTKIWILGQLIAPDDTGLKNHLFSLNCDLSDKAFQGHLIKAGEESLEIIPFFNNHEEENRLSSRATHYASQLGRKTQLGFIKTLLPKTNQDVIALRL